MSGHKSGGLSAFPTAYKMGNETAYAAGMSREDYALVAIASGLAANPAALDLPLDQLGPRCEALCDAVCAAMDRRFAARQNRGASSKGGW